MEINYSGKAIVHRYNGFCNDSAGKTIRQVDLAIGLDRTVFESVFGHEFAKIVFSAYVEDVDDDGVVRGAWRLKSPKPAKDVICGFHIICIDGMSVNTQPKVVSFETVSETEKVFTIIRIGLSQAQTKLRRNLENCLGVTVDLDIKPVNRQLSFDDGSAGHKLTVLGEKLLEAQG